jgi:hypothetical protein
VGKLRFSARLAKSLALASTSFSDLSVFETEFDGRTFAGADASLFDFVVFMAFF